MTITVRDIFESIKVKDSLDPQEYAAEQNVGIVLMLKQDKTLARLVAAWKNVPIGPLKYDTVCPPETPEAFRLRWMWAQIEPDPIPVWISTAGLMMAPHIVQKCWVAIQNEMVLPDGTVSFWARNYLTRAAQRV